MKFWPLIKVLPVRTHFRFVRLSRVFATLSILAVVASLFLALFPFKPPCGGLACGVDFKGGTVMEISTAPKAIDLATVRGALDGLGIGDVGVQGLGAPSSAMVRFQAPKGADISATVTRVQAKLTQTLGKVRFVSTDVVGPTVSGELLTSGVMGLGLAILLMLLYIWFRFELQFGLGAVAALFHDVFLTFGLIAILGRLGKLEFDLKSVAAILTIIGYSMNDTVVVFDRFRENLRKYKRMPLGEVIDMSINEMLTRTIITSMTAVLALAALAVFGGPTLYGLSVIMLFGIVIGTYSSIYIAAPVILLWGVKRGGDDEVAQPLKPGPVRYSGSAVARDAPSIDAYGDGGFRLSGQWHAGSLLIVADQARPWPVTALSELTVTALEPVFAAGRAEVEFLLLGVGVRNAQPPRAVREALLAAGMGFEFMDTPAAAKLYNVLTSEGRRLALALIAV